MYVAHRCTNTPTHTHTHTHSHYSLTHSISNSATIFAGNKLVPSACPFFFSFPLPAYPMLHPAIFFLLLLPIPWESQQPQLKNIIYCSQLSKFISVCAFTFCAHCVHVCSYCFCSSCVSFSHCDFLMIALRCIVVLSPSILDCMLRRRFVYFVFRFLAAWVKKALKSLVGHGWRGKVGARRGVSR